jgi:hypothetical protein
MYTHGFLFNPQILRKTPTLFVGYLVYRVHRKSDQIEDIIAAVYLQARRVLEQYRP